MREKIKDKGRLEHILNAIDGIMSDKELYTLENIKEITLLFHGFTKYVEIIGEAVYIDRLREKSLSGYKNFQFPFWTISFRSGNNLSSRRSKRNVAFLET